MHYSMSHLSSLKVVFADTFKLYLQTLNFHWHVHGIHFSPLHAMFEEQYTSLADFIDEVAERIRTLDETVPATTAEISKLSKMKEPSEYMDSKAMLKALVNSYTVLISSIKSTIDISDNRQDHATSDMLIRMLGHHEKQLWMIKSHLM